MYKRPACLQITPRHLIFNILVKYNGKIKREELYERIHGIGLVLAKKGYKIPITFKGCKGEYWNENIDNELFDWVSLGIINQQTKDSIKFYPKKHQLYTFIPNEYPFDSLDNIIKVLNSGLDQEPRNALEEALKIAFDKNYKVRE